MGPPQIKNLLAFKGFDPIEVKSLGLVIISELAFLRLGLSKREEAAAVHAARPSPGGRAHALCVVVGTTAPNRNCLRARVKKGSKKKMKGKEKTNKQTTTKKRLTQ